MPATRKAVLMAAAARTDFAVAQATVSGLLTPSVVLARLWLVGADGELHLAGSAGTPAGGGSYKNLDGSFARIPVGIGKIGRIATSRKPLIVSSVRGDEEWISNPGWIARQGVRAFFGFPLLSADYVVGVLAVFERSSPAGERAADLQFLADYAAARLADVRDRAPHRPSLTAIDNPDRGASAPSPLTPQKILTREALRALERETIAAALGQTAGRVFGPNGAARLLGMKPTTLASRIKVLGLAATPRLKPTRRI